MGFKSRKLCIWLISAGAVLVVYLLYNQITRTPFVVNGNWKSFDFAQDGEPVEPLENGNYRAPSKIGMVGGVGVGTVQKAKYTHLNAKKQVDREFGFEKLLHAEGNEWEIEKPYMNIFRGELKCYMTADEGVVQVEEAVGKLSPKDATLTGNVVIHILPEKKSKIKEGFIELDDVIFISEKSQFSTAGPVKFTSQDAQMLGRGMELVYNEELNRLEYLKIIALETLRIRQSSKESLFSPRPSEGRGSSKATDIENSAGPSRVAQTDRPERRETRDEGRGTKGGDYYRCVFRKNVIINSPEQLIFADEVSIDNLLWSKGPDRAGEEQGTRDEGRGTSGSTVLSGSPSKEDEGQGIGDDEQFVDIVVTCDNGIVVVPMVNGNWKSFDFAQDGEPVEPLVNGNYRAPITNHQLPSTEHQIGSFNDEKGRPTFIARKIDYYVDTEDTVASGPSELTFYANDVTGTEAQPRPSERSEGKQPAVPVKVTAQEKAEFLPALNQVIFEGDVLCTMLRPVRRSGSEVGEKADFQQKNALSSPRLTVDLSKDKQSRVDIKHLTANGGVVQLDTSRWAGEKLLGFTKLKCLKFDYDAGQQMFLATGSGVIAVDNSKIAEPGKGVGKFSLQKPCYAVVRNFDTLKYLTEADIIIADAGAEQILIDYFPVVKGQYGQQTSATANHVEAVLYETAGGQTELLTLSAKGGITYEEEKAKKGKAIQFAGSEMFYDGSKSMITAWGDESQPCFLNGALAPGIEYDLKTDRIKTKITGPGMLQMGK